MSFKIADLFPIRREDLCEITEEANKRWRTINAYRDWETGNRVEANHPLYGMTLLCLSEPKLTKHGGRIYYDVFCQQDLKYYQIAKDELQRILLL